jgi:hypothetical protein
MQQIKATIGENHPMPIALFTRGELNEFVLRNNLSHSCHYDKDTARYGLLGSVSSFYHAGEAHRLPRCETFSAMWASFE